MRNQTTLGLQSVGAKVGRDEAEKKQKKKKKKIYIYIYIYT